MSTKKPGKGGRWTVSKSHFTHNPRATLGAHDKQTNNRRSPSSRNCDQTQPTLFLLRPKIDRQPTLCVRTNLLMIRGDGGKTYHSPLKFPSSNYPVGGDRFRNAANVHASFRSHSRAHTHTHTHTLKRPFRWLLFPSLILCFTPISDCHSVAGVRHSSPPNIPIPPLLNAV